MKSTITVKDGRLPTVAQMRRVFEELAPDTEEYANKNPGDAMPLGARVKNFFPVFVENDDLLSEDYAFCAKWREAGGSIWCAPWCEIAHAGTYIFRGSYKDAFAWQG